MRIVCGLLTTLALSGCATIVNDANIPLTVSFSDGSSGQCTFRNKRGVWTSAIPTSSVMIRRSDDALNYDCSSADGRKASGQIRSEMEGGKMMASVIFWDLGITDSITDKHRTYQGNVVIPLPPKTTQTAAAQPVAGNSSGAIASPETGKNEFAVSRISRSMGCESITLLSQTASTETYQAACPSGQFKLISCEFTNCHVMQ
jgi:hypothetical protein